jgi:hypothetical protein
MFDQIDDYVHRPARYRNIDGIWEMGIGVLWLGMAALGRLQASTPGNSAWRWRGAYLLGLAGLGLLVFSGVAALKKRVTYPRTGFVKYRGLARGWVAGLIAGAIAIPAGILSAYLARGSSLTMTVAVGSVMWALLYACATRLAEAWRWVVLVVMVAGPVVISTLPLDHGWRDTLSMGFLGLTFLVSGVIALCLYLRRTRPPDQEAE